MPEPPLPPPPPELAVETNAARLDAGLGSLAMDADLGAAALGWARSMASSGVLDHGDFADRIARAAPGLAGAECIAAGQGTAAEAVAAWLGDPPHRANLLGPFDRLGVGSARGDDGTWFWCADFAGDP